jgi:hypothetical protein
VSDAKVYPPFNARGVVLTWAADFDVTRGIDSLIARVGALVDGTAARLTPEEREVLRGLVAAVEPYTVGAPNAQSYPMTLLIEALPLIARLVGEGT